MNQIGFMISTKENEKRRALLPHHISYLKYKEHLFFEEGYGEDLGYSDEEYIAAGANIVPRNEALAKKIVCDPKIGDATYLNELDKGQAIFGWVHAVQNKEITDIILTNNLTAIAWEDMNEDGRHVFWRNNEIAGEAAIMHAFTLFGKMPYECKVAIIGKGNIARGAYKALAALGAEIVVFDRKMEKLLNKELGNFDVIVNALLWDINRTDHIIYKEDLAKLRKNAMIVDISCDKAGAIETSVPTTIENPIYFVDGVLHYVVDHTPALYSHTVTESLGQELIKYLDLLIETEVSKLTNRTLKEAVIIEEGKIIDSRITSYQKRYQTV